MERIGRSGRGLL